MVFPIRELNLCLGQSAVDHRIDELHGLFKD